MNKIFFPLLCLCFTLVFIACDSKNADPIIIANLQTAYNGESNASAKYKMYAMECDSAGYKGCCALFKAASHSESIHAALEAKILEEMGVEPKCEIVLPPFSNVKNALEDAVKCEKYEYTIMYPSFMKTAQDKGRFNVVHVYDLANSAEIEHARLYRMPLKNLENYKESNITYSVCNMCGFMFDQIIKKCTTCHTIGNMTTYK